MSGWQKCLRSSPIEWLLEKNNPSIRYFTLRDLLGREDVEVAEAKATISGSEIVTSILSKQRSEGYWEKATDPYLPKYKATYWQVMTLGQLRIDRSDERVQRSCDWILNLQLENGGFSMYTREGALSEYQRRKRALGIRGKSPPEPELWAQSLVNELEYTCLTGNMIAALIRLGYADDHRVKKASDWLLSVQNRDGGWLCPYWKAHIKDTHSCFHGTICPLEAFSEVPETERTSEMNDAVNEAAEFLLMHRLYKTDHHGFQAINRLWLKFSFPWFYGYDLLRGLSVLTKLGFVDDERLVDATKVLIQKDRKSVV
jgi:prenyltransferase beta subunit